MIQTKLKMAFRIWLAIYPSITVFQAILGGWLQQFPLPLRTLLLTLVLVPWVVFAGLPLIQLMAKWIFSNARNH